MPLEVALPLVTSNPARALKLERKGRLAEGCGGDLLVVDRGSMEIRDVVARGRRLVADGVVLLTAIPGEEQPQLTLVGEQAPAPLVPHAEQNTNRRSRAALDALRRDVLS